jgi:uncharacterized protein YndB with AHSA1/START domain
MDKTETLVTVVFREQAEGTEVVLTHERLPGEESKTRHTEGWLGCFEKLEQIL